MSALAGIWNFDGRPGAGEACARMLAAQAIYGPHDNAQWSVGTMAFGRRLFRMLPEDSHDRQLLSGGNGRYVLAADLRLDNRDELISELRISAERAGRLADAGLLMSAWEQWQESCFDRLVGVYAFALWDRAEQCLVLARDPLGARPLHYHRGKNFFAFASMPKGLHALPEIPCAPDEERVAEFLALLPDSGSASFFKDVERVEMGCVVTVTAGGVRARRHWDPPRRTLTLANAEEYAEGVRHHLDQAVRAQLRGTNGAVATHLSAGFDSSAVTTSAALQLAPSGGKAFAFTAVPREGFDGRSPKGRLGDEGPIAARTAAMYPNVEHISIRNNRHSPLANLDRQFFLYDSPMLNLCNMVWLEAIHDAARARQLPVLLTGQMGNMTISYDGLTLLPQLLRRGRWIKWLREGRGLVRERHSRWRGVLAATIGPYTPPAIWALANRWFSDKDVGVETYSAINPERFKQLQIEKRARARALDVGYRPRRDGFESRLWVMRRVDLGNLMKGTLAGWGIDQRDPTTDRRLIEFCLSIPEEEHLVNGIPKALARRAFAGRVAPEVVQAREKGYQAADWYEGVIDARDSLREELTRLGRSPAAETALHLAPLTQLVDQMPAGGWETDKVIHATRLKLLRGISAGHFLRRATGSNA